MDSARVYNKYLNAKNRVESINLLISKHRHLPLKNLSKSRLPVGERLSDIYASLGIPNLNSLKHPYRREYYCQNTSSQRKTKHPLRFKCKNKHPVKVEPSLQHFKEPTLRFYKSSAVKKLKKRIRQKDSLKCSTKNLNEPINTSLLEPKKCTSYYNSDDKNSPNIESCLSKDISSSKAYSESVRKENSESVKCQEEVNCEEVPQISMQLTTLMKKLQNQVACEIKKKKKLNAINDRLKQLSETVNSSNDKCAFLEEEKKKLTLEKLEINNMESLENDKLCQKRSSLCPYCKNKDLPVLSSLQNELFKLMGKRLFTEVALTILLRADNVYHVSVRDMATGNILGCLLVNELGIKEANCRGLFREILTFSMIDVCSAMKIRDAIFGENNGLTTDRKDLFKKLHNPILYLKLDHEFSNLSKSEMKSNLSVSQAMYRISSISNSLNLPDE